MPLANQTAKNIKSYFYHAIIAFSVLVALTANSAEHQLEVNDNLMTVSVGMNKTSKDSHDRQQNILLTKSIALALLDAKHLTRAAKHQRQDNTKQNKMSRSLKTKSYSHSFSIYDAFSYLLDDYDEDGFYQTFSVVFDADLHSSSSFDSAEVYAELYLSQNGGPWIYYFTTDNFILYGDSDTDEYEVITTLHQGYSSDYYDVLIDLYEVGFDDLVATYSSDDNNALYALPLESTEYDIEYVVEVHDDYAGSMSVVLLMLLLVRLIPKRYIS